MRLSIDIRNKPLSEATLRSVVAILVLVLGCVIMAGTASEAQAHGISHNGEAPGAIHQTANLLNGINNLVTQPHEKHDPFCCHTDNAGFGCSSAYTLLTASSDGLMALQVDRHILLLRQVLFKSRFQFPLLRPPIL